MAFILAVEQIFLHRYIQIVSIDGQIPAPGDRRDIGLPLVKLPGIHETIMRHYY